ncbi:MAG: DNA topoisomerase I, partial [Planctomycetes bacterium]|nr:DNA topoisomerase I [Planctomycetota bacterium]
AEFKWLKSGERPRAQKLKEEAKAVELIEEIKKFQQMRVESVEKKEQKKKPQPPFTTSDMQAKAALGLKLDAARTMSLAQSLYEDGHITYHRTDSYTISDEALAMVRAEILKTYGQDYLPAKALTVKAKAGAQEAHECIRPTSLGATVPPGLAGEKLKLYELIRNQFISSQMSEGIDALTVVRLEAGAYVFEARGRVEIFDGFRRLNRDEIEEKSSKAKEQDEEEKQTLPNLETDDQVDIERLEKKEQKSKPPPRYSESSLIKKLEREGIGRPSTYATIVDTIKKRNYVRVEKQRYYAEELGLQVTDYLVERFPRVMQLDFTRVCETRLDSIGSGNLDYREFLGKFWTYLKTQLYGKK